KMPKSADRELQAGLLKEIYELNARKRKLQDDIRSLDAANNSIQATAALRDIEAYKSQRPLHAKLPSHYHALVQFFPHSRITSRGCLRCSSSVHSTQTPLGLQGQGYLGASFPLLGEFELLPPSSVDLLHHFFSILTEARLFLPLRIPGAKFASRSRRAA